MRYFVHLSTTNQPKNQLQKAAREVLEAETNHIVEHGWQFIENLSKQIQQLNLLYPNCTPLTVSHYGFTMTGDDIGISLGDQFTVGFHLYPIQEDNDGAT